jgi:hypothetical protein
VAVGEQSRHDELDRRSLAHHGLGDLVHHGGDHLGGVGRRRPGGGSAHVAHWCTVDLCDGRTASGGTAHQ